MNAYTRTAWEWQGICTEKLLDLQTLGLYLALSSIQTCSARYRVQQDLTVTCPRGHIQERSDQGTLIFGSEGFHHMDVLVVPASLATRSLLATSLEQLAP